MDLYRTRDHVTDFDDYVAEYRTMSEHTRRRVRSDLNVPYGAGPHEIIDLFFPSAPVSPCPIHLFIHGGYWRMFSKDDFSFVANTVTECGAIAAIMDYDLMPQVRMETIVTQVQRAWNWLHDNARKLGGDPNQLSVSGHSAGAHLATFTFSNAQTGPLPKSALLLSGVFDLQPLQDSFLKSLIALTDEEVTRFSPLHLVHAPGPEVLLAFGDQETLPFARQPKDFSAILTGQGIRSSVFALQASNHMSGVRDMGYPGKEAGKLLRSVISRR